MKLARSIRTQLTAVFVLGVCVPLCGGLAVMGFLELRSFDKEVISTNTTVARLAAAYCAADLAFLDQRAASSSLGHLARFNEIAFAAIYDDQGKLFASFERQPGAALRQLPEGTPRVTSGSVVDVEDDHIDLLEPIRHGGAQFGTLVLRVSREPPQARVLAFVWGMALIAVGLWAFSLVFAATLQRVISNPILSMAEVARRITEHADYSTRAVDLDRNEIGELSRAFNTMMAEIERREQDLRVSQGALQESYARLEATQHELVEKERLAAVGELSAVMAHEVRNALGVIFNSIEALRRSSQGSDQVSLLVGILREEADRLNRMVEDLLDFARPAPAALTQRSLEAVVSAAVEVAACSADARQIRFEVDVPSELPAVPFDERMIRQALVNLIVNAMQAMPSGGEIRIRASREEREGRPYVRIEVADQGPGISPESQARMFQPFFTTKAAGTGLGLAVVRRFVEAHQGFVTVESAAGAGATFALHLPERRPGAPRGGAPEVDSGAA